MSKVTGVKEAAKDALLGTTEEPVQLSAQAKARFMSHAVKDPETGEFYMGAEEFLNAVAPKDGDYVSQSRPSTYLVSFRLSILPLFELSPYDHLVGQR